MVITKLNDFPFDFVTELVLITITYDNNLDDLWTNNFVSERQS